MTVRCYVGNYNTGVFYTREIHALSTDSCIVEDTVYEMLDLLGCNHTVWATYNARNSIPSTDRDFKRYMEYRKSHEEVCC